MKVKLRYCKSDISSAFVTFTTASQYILLAFVIILAGDVTPINLSL